MKRYSNKLLKSHIKKKKNLDLIGLSNYLWVLVLEGYIFAKDSLVF